MTGFFARMGERAAGREPALALRPVPPFQQALAPEVELLVEAAPPAPPVRRRPSARGPEPEPAPPVEAPRAPTQEQAAARAEPVRPPATPPADAPAAERPRERPSQPPPAGPPPPRPASSAPEPPPAERPRAPAPARAETPAGAPPTANPPAPPPPRPPRRRPRPRAAPAPAFDLETLLRDHVLPTLAERGVVERDEQPAPRPARAGSPPKPGTFAVETGRVTGLPAAAPEPATLAPTADPPDVHVHIDRVVVTRAPAAPPPAPPRPPIPARSTVDHDAYLRRRHER